MLLVLDFKPPIHPPLVGVLDPTRGNAVIVCAISCCVEQQKSKTLIESRHPIPSRLEALAEEIVDSRLVGWACNISVMPLCHF